MTGESSDKPDVKNPVVHPASIFFIFIVLIPFFQFDNHCSKCAVSQDSYSPARRNISESIFKEPCNNPSHFVRREIPVLFRVSFNNSLAQIKKIQFNPLIGSSVILSLRTGHCSIFQQSVVCLSENPLSIFQECTHWLS